MTTTSKYFLSATALSLLLAVAVTSPSNVMAQSAEAETTEEVAVATDGPAPVGVELGAELLEELAASEEQMTNDMADINASLENLDLQQENADQLFDDMVEAIKRQAALGDPEGTFIQRVEKLIDDSRQLQIEARDEGDTELAEDMESTIESLEVTRTTALELHADSARSIREIESQKSRFVLRIRAKRLSMAAKVAEEGVLKLQDFNTKLGEIRKTIAPEDEGVVAQ